MKHLMFLLSFTICATSYSLGATKCAVKLIDETHVVPQAIQDPVTKVIYYLESDGRHIAAIRPDGKILWIRDPFVDAKLQPYRLKRPVICYFNFVDHDWWKIHRRLGPAEEFIGINFTSSQFGVIRKDTGEFMWFGQD